VLLVLIALRPRHYKPLTGAWVGLGVLGVVLIFAMNTLPIFAGLRDVPYLGRLTQLLDQESTTAQVRTLIWQGASEMVTPHEPLVRPDGESDSINFLRPLVGYGPEAMWVAFNRFYPASLSQVEARNASPDRSHNETWDSLVITGLLGFLAYMALFLSIFYWAMRWLGLLVNKRDTWLFFGLLIGNGLLLSVIFYFYDGRLTRYFGVAFPAGLMFGLLLYIMAAAFLHPNYRPDRADLPRQLLLIALFTAIIAHFVEIHFGIAIAATRTYFWIYTALFTVLGLRWAQPQPLAVAVEVEAQPEPEVVQPKGKKGKQSSRPPVRRRGEPLPWTPLTVVSDALIFLTSVFLFTTNARGAESALGALWGAFTTRVEGGQTISSPAILILLLFTWLVMLVLGLSAEALSRREMPPLRWWLQAIALHGVVVWGVWLIYGALQGARVAPLQIPPGLSAGETLNLQLEHVARHFTIFTTMLIGWILVAGTVYAWKALSDRTLSVARRPILSAVAGVAAGVALFMIVSFVNVGLVRADVIYKQGQQFDSQRNWVSSIELYKRALAARESEDHYMLFLGRALLENAKAVEAQSAGDFPPDATMDDVMALTPELVATMGRQELLRAAEVVLLNAQRVNPLNTDHTANLARLYRTWSDLTDDPAQRQEMLDRSMEQYEIAVALSPQAAHLWNEKGNAHLARNEPELAEAAYRMSLSLDPYFEQSYLLLADLLEGQQRYEEGEAILRDGIALIGERRGERATVQLLSFLGVNLSRAGNLPAAIDAMEAMLAAEPNNITALRNIAVLQRDAGDLEAAAAAVDQAIDLLAGDQSGQLADMQAVGLEIYQLQAAAAPDDYAPLYKLARILQQQGDGAGALLYAQQAAALAPAEAQGEVNQLLAELGG
jgi:tetratricopeptide (TPR) repeat protein